MVLAFLFQVILEHEAASPWSVLGAVLIVGCVFLIAAKKCRLPPSEAGGAKLSSTGDSGALELSSHDSTDANASAAGDWSSEVDSVGVAMLPVRGRRHGSGTAGARRGGALVSAMDDAGSDVDNDDVDFAIAELDDSTTTTGLITQEAASSKLKASRRRDGYGRVEDAGV